MIALIKTFTLQPSAVSEHFLGDNKVASSFALATSAGKYFPGDNRVASSFALAYGGYELDGVILAKKLEKTKLIRQK
jgi:hypothetical protein